MLLSRRPGAAPNLGREGLRLTCNVPVPISLIALQRCLVRKVGYCPGGAFLCHLWQVQSDIEIQQARLGQHN